MFCETVNLLKMWDILGRYCTIFHHLLKFFLFFLPFSSISSPSLFKLFQYAPLPVRKGYDVLLYKTTPKPVA